MSSLKDFLGQSLGPYQEEVSAERIRKFSKAIGSQTLEVTQPVFLTCFRQGEFDFFSKMGVQLSQILHTDQEYKIDAAIVAGDILFFTTTISQVLEKQRLDYKMCFMTLCSDFYVQRSLEPSRLPIGQSQSTIVIREKVN